MRLLCFFFMLCSALMPLAAGQPPQQINLMPVPASFRVGPGQLLIDQTFSVALTGEKGTLLERVIQNFVGDLSRKTGMQFEGQSSGGAWGGRVSTGKSDSAAHFIGRCGG